MGSRYDMYNNVHKGLRRALCSLLVDAGATDWAEQAGIVARWRVLEAQLAAHHQHEDRFIGPHLARIAPVLFAQMELDHHALDAEVERVSAAASAIACSESARTFYRALAGFIGRYLGHMADEEGAYSLALQAAYTDRDLMAIEGELIASIPPDVMAAFAALMLPAMNLPERFEMLDGVRKNAPPEAFAGMCQLASQVLDARAWQALNDKLGAA